MHSSNEEVVSGLCDVPQKDNWIEMTFMALSEGEFTGYA